jgi:hypothetical protein
MLVFSDNRAAAMETVAPFPLALHELLVDNDLVTQTGRPNWAALVSELRSVHYETLRQAATGRRRPTPRLMEECARALRVRPVYFLEYRLHWAQRAFDTRAVGHERALQNLALSTLQEPQWPPVWFA